MSLPYAEDDEALARLLQFQEQSGIANGGAMMPSSQLPPTDQELRDMALAREMAEMEFTAGGGGRDGIQGASPYRTSAPGPSSLETQRPVSPGPRQVTPDPNQQGAFSLGPSHGDMDYARQLQEQALHGIHQQQGGSTRQRQSSFDDTHPASIVDTQTSFDVSAVTKSEQQSEEDDLALARRIQAEEVSGASSVASGGENNEDERLARLMAATQRSLRDLNEQELDDLMFSMTKQHTRDTPSHRRRREKLKQAQQSSFSSPSSPIRVESSMLGDSAVSLSAPSSPSIYDDIYGESLYADESDPLTAPKKSSNGISAQQKISSAAAKLGTGVGQGGEESGRKKAARRLMGRGGQQQKAGLKPPPPSSLKPPPASSLKPPPPSSLKPPPPSSIAGIPPAPMLDGPAGIPAPIPDDVRSGIPAAIPAAPAGIPAAIPAAIPPPPAGRHHRVSNHAPCAKCGLAEGTFLQAKDRMYHPECFRCAACGEKIDVLSKFAFRRLERHDGSGSLEPYHAACIPQDGCVVCKQPLPVAGVGGMVCYVKHPFFEKERMCPHHAEMRNSVRRCAGCHRFEPFHEPFADLGDSGRCVCFACCRSVIMDSTDAVPLWRMVLHFFEHQMKIPVWEEMRQIPILVVGYETLNEQLARSDSATHGLAPSSQAMTRGLCVTDHQHGARLKMPSMRFNRTSSSFEAMDINSQGYTYYDFQEHGNANARVSAIMCLSGLPRDLTASVLAHEATHAWIKLHPDYDYFRNPILDPQVEEGLAQLVSMLFLNEGLEETSELAPGDSPPSDGQLRQYFRFCIESDEHEVYGGGYLKAAEAYKQVGIQALMRHVVLYGTFPVL